MACRRNQCESSPCSSWKLRPRQSHNQTQFQRWLLGSMTWHRWKCHLHVLVCSVLAEDVISLWHKFWGEYLVDLVSCNRIASGLVWSIMCISSAFFDFFNDFLELIPQEVLPHWYDVALETGVRVSEWLNLMAFLRTEDSDVHIVHISRVITAYTLESLSSSHRLHTIYGPQLTLRKME